MNEKFLTIKEFAEKAGVSVQSIYKRISKKDNPIHSYLKEVEGVKMLDSSALDILYTGKNGPAEEKPGSKGPEVPENERTEEAIHTDILLNILERQLSEQGQQLQEKDRQLREKDSQISSLLARLEDTTRIIDQQQQLTALNVKALSEKQPGEDQADRPPEPDAAEPDAPPEQKRGLFRRLFRK